MTPERYNQIQEIFLRVCDLAPGERTAYLSRECRQDAELEAGVRRLLQNDSELLTPKQSTGIRARIEGMFSALSGAAATPAVPTQIGRYRIIRLIGAGGMGQVYEAEQDHPRRRVALKLMRGGLPGHPSHSLQRRFHQEANALAKLQHPGIAQIYDAGVAQVEAVDIPYFAMEFVPGLPLSAFADQNHLDIRARLGLVADVADAVHYAHTRGVIHRDLKPGNILVMLGSGVGVQGSEGGANPTTPATAKLSSPEPRTLNPEPCPKVLDFGVARITDSDTRAATRHTEIGQIIGTLAYMSPEQVAGDAYAIDPRSDVYALGVILYELLSGTKPLDLDSKSFVQAVRAIQELEPARLSHGKLWDGRAARVLRGDIETIVAKALQKDRNHRYASAAQFADDIRRHLNHEPIAARPSTALYQLRKFARRNRGFAAGIAIALAALLIGSIATVWLAISEMQQRSLADENSRKAAANERRATLGEIAARRNAYRLGIAAAQGSLDDPARARRHLADAPAEYRNWEWRYLNNRVDPAIARQTADADSLPAGQFTATGEALTALIRDGSLRVMRVASGVELARTTLAPGAQIRNLSLRPDGGRVGWLDLQSGGIMIWDPPAAPRPLGVPIHDIVSHSFDCAHDRVVVQTRLSLIVIDLDPERNVFQKDLDSGRTPNRVLISDDGAVVVADFNFGGAHDLVVIDASSGAELNRYGSVDRIAAMALDTNGRRILFADPLHRIFTIPMSRAPGGLLGHSPNSAQMLDMRFSPNGRYLASSGDDERVILTNPESLAPQIVGGIAARSIRVADDGHVLASTHGVIQLYSAQPEAPLNGHTSFVYSVAVSPDGALIASAGWDGTVRLWAAQTGALLKTLPVTNWTTEPLAVWFSRDGAELRAQFNTALPFKAWRLTDFEALPECDTAEYAAGVHAVADSYGQRVAVSYDGRSIVSSGDTQATIQDRHSGAIVRAVKHLGVTAVELSHDNTRLALGASDGSITVYDVNSGNELAHRQAHDRRVYTLAFTADDTRLASGGDDSVIQISDASSLEPLMALRGHTSYVHALAFTPGDQALISASGDTTVRIWPAPEPGR